MALQSRLLSVASDLPRLPAAGIYRPNLWPDGVMPELRPAFKALGTCVCEVADKILAVCRGIVEQHGRSSAGLPNPSFQAFTRNA